MDTLDSRLIKINENPHQPTTDYKALSEALQRDMSEAVRRIADAIESLQKWQEMGMPVSDLAFFDLEQALHSLDASHLVTTEFGRPLPVVTEDGAQ